MEELFGNLLQEAEFQEAVTHLGLSFEEEVEFMMASSSDRANNTLTDPKILQGYLDRLSKDDQAQVS